MNRGEILDAVKKTICNDRQDIHGDPEDTHRVIADLWNVYMKQAAVRNSGHCKLMPRDVAVMMCLFKIARHAMNPNHNDNIHDLIGYAAIAAELSFPPTKEQQDANRTEQ